jgi:hypothetical protein
MVYDDDGIPVLPTAGKRWTRFRKATVITAVRHGFVPVEEVCELYRLSVDELLAWERDFDRFGVNGLLAKRAGCGALKPALRVGVYPTRLSRAQRPCSGSRAVLKPRPPPRHQDDANAGDPWVLRMVRPEVDCRAPLARPRRWQESECAY